MVTNLLGRAAQRHGSCCGGPPGIDCSDYGFDNQSQRRYEERAWKRDQWPLLYFNPRFEPEDDYDNDPSDCRHGCNGDCVTSGSERCTFTCHEENHGPLPQDR